MDKRLSWITRTITVLVIFLVLYFIAFGTRAQTVDDYYNLFLVDAKAQGKMLVNVPPTFVETAADLFINIEGVRTEVEAYTHHIERTIYFNTTGFVYNNNLQVLVYHELGHYYLRRVHTTRKSIMNISIWGWDGFIWDDMSENHQQFYIDELFK